MAQQWDGELPDDLQEPKDGADDLAKMKSFLHGCAGEEAVKAVETADFRERALHEAREQMFDRIAKALLYIEPSADE